MKHKDAEEINYSYDGVLYAEMVRNRACRARRQDVPHWFLVEDGAAQAKMGLIRGPARAKPCRTACGSR